MIVYQTTGQCKTFDQIPAGAIVESVNGMPVVGQCEQCNRPIADDADAGHVTNGAQYAEGVWFCEDCDNAA